MLINQIIDLESKENHNKTTRIVGTVAIILSGIILYLDKVFVWFDITLDNLHGWKNTANYIWNLCQTFSPILIMCGMYLRAYTLSTIVPIFCYVLQFFFVIDSSMTADKGSTWLYVIGTSLGIIIVFLVVRWHLYRIGRFQKLEKELMEEIIQTDTDIFSGGDHEVVKKEKDKKITK